VSTIDLNNLTDEEADRLSDLAHDAASNAASDANNNGTAVEFLIELGWTEQQIIAHLEAL